ncbi:MAG TPA: glycosyltransferase family 2 protein [Chloroflexota bacterium]|nr:glycosyltransferase family 2 protein [Chloroflexota bacterium]HUM67795.1 glycosyltransferase family 2 protein [Chloroflexota bacterium]
MYEANNHPLIYALVLNWNGANEAIECLHSLKRQTYPHLKLLLVDNGSVDDSIACITAVHPEIELVANAKNLGFAGGVNAGLHHAFAAGADHVLILNNDLILEENCVAELAAHTAVDVGFVAATIYYTDDPQRIWSMSGNINPWTLERIVDVRGQLDEGQFPRVMERHFAPGGASLMSRRAYELTAGFDEGFFLYYEDADLSLRAHKAGLRVLVCSQAKMWHAISKSSGGSDSPRERYWMARSSVRYFAKHARWWQIPLIVLWRLGSALKTTWRLWRHGRYESLNAYWRGLWHGMRDGRGICH